MDVLANVGSGRDLGAVLEDVEDRLEEVQFPLGYHAELLGEGAERAAAQRRLLLAGLAAVVGIFLLLQAAFRSWRLATLAFLALPAALVGGVLAAYAGDGIVSLGALVGFLAVLGIAARNSILLIRHFQHLEWVEGEAFGPALVLRGARERLSPILMTTLATGLALVPLVFAADLPGHEIEHPMAVVILGGLVTSTLLNLFVVPVLYLRLGSIRESPTGAPGLGPGHAAPPGPRPNPRPPPPRGDPLAGGAPRGPSPPSPPALAAAPRPTRGRRATMCLLRCPPAAWVAWPAPAGPKPPSPAPPACAKRRAR